MKVQYRPKRGGKVHTLGDLKNASIVKDNPPFPGIGLAKHLFGRE